MHELNLSSLVSRGGGEETAVRGDVTGQDGFPVSLDVLQFLSAVYIPHLKVREEKGVRFVLCLISRVCVCVCVLHLDTAIKGPGHQSCIHR